MTHTLEDYLFPFSSMVFDGPQTDLIKKLKKDKANQATYIAQLEKHINELKDNIKELTANYNIVTKKNTTLLKNIKELEKRFVAKTEKLDRTEQALKQANALLALHATPLTSQATPADAKVEPKVEPKAEPQVSQSTSIEVVIDDGVNKPISMKAEGENLDLDSFFDSLVEKLKVTTK